ncbi:DUF3575 domain-containing protein [Bacteroides fragilis]|nr:DUF3575 domain-containing protein [Bacteroides fragilis]MCS3163861.1 DUF3575 domain-containing protein [Bacteroides fragilis]
MSVEFLAINIVTKATVLEADFLLGYNRPLSPHWNLEFEAGLGVLWTHYDKYVCKACGQKVATFKGARLIPTKLAVNIVYLF